MDETRNVTSCNGDIFTIIRGRSIETWLFVTHPKGRIYFYLYYAVINVRRPAETLKLSSTIALCQQMLFVYVYIHIHTKSHMFSGFLSAALF